MTLAGVHTMLADYERRDATEDEINELPHVAGSISSIFWIALVVSGEERFLFYAATTPWQNYAQYDRENTSIPGALGLGEAMASNISSAFYAFTFLMSVAFAVLSDVWFGRYITLSITDGSVKLVGFILVVILIGLGTGGVKATITPFIVIATLSLITSTYLEKKVGYWAAYLMPLCAFAVVLPLLILWCKAFVKLPPQGSVIPQLAKVICFSARDKFRLDAAKLSYQAERDHREVDWDDLFASEIKRGLSALPVLSPTTYAIIKSVNSLITQPGEMRLDGVPNDAIQAINPVFCVILGPLLQKFLGSMAFAAGVQKLIYSRDGGRIGNDISILGFNTLAEYSYSEAPTNMRTLVQSLVQFLVQVLYLYTALAATMVVVASGF
ncbi:hypothetical protein BDV36DRAFT_308860 [Aspergillus pseudocaelatus]|uniref:ABC transmembrane type-1 domain-containing protein n=1 Tax=Aspergillus pseudocaelatus TaxID=1825620 RepID=A0ABQ6WLR5_9EURO|nr:hypothetical protein BDV36DRAFT_308860 [Aspergillus pseudocaelatus]